MATLTYTHTIIDADWYDANPLMSNFLQARNAINGELDEGNFSAAMNPTLGILDCSDEIAGNLIQPAGDIEIVIPEGLEIDIRLESDPLVTRYLNFSETGVTIGV
jgi:hypothetical protein